MTVLWLTDEAAVGGEPRRDPMRRPVPTFDWALALVCLIAVAHRHSTRLSG
jgi:hypothetical protein